MNQAKKPGLVFQHQPRQRKRQILVRTAAISRFNSTIQGTLRQVSGGRGKIDC